MIVGVVSRKDVPLSSLYPHTTHYCVSVGVPPKYTLPLINFDDTLLPLATDKETPKTPDRGKIGLTPSHLLFTPPPHTHPHISYPRKRSKSAPVFKTSLSQLLLRPLTVDVERCIPSPLTKVGVSPQKLSPFSKVGMSPKIPQLHLRSHMPHPSVSHPQDCVPEHRHHSGQFQHLCVQLATHSQLLVRKYCILV